LLSTHAIENPMRNYRGKTANVTRWRAETDQISRWNATALLHIETGFHRFRGHTDPPKFVYVLLLNSISAGVEGASPLHTYLSNLGRVQSTKPRNYSLFTTIHPVLLTTSGSSPDDIERAAI
jgi:hypothetical protein